jgi:hypothetical protein
MNRAIQKFCSECHICYLSPDININVTKKIIHIRHVISI